MKIGILTLPIAENYGGILQAIALYRYLHKEGHDVVLIYKAHHSVFWKRIAKSILLNPFFSFLPIERIKNHKEWQKRKSFHRPFIEKEIYKISQDLYTKEDLENFAKKENFDAVIVGSDQVWRKAYMGSMFYQNYFLDFVDGSKTKKIAYAASFGKDHWEGKDDLEEKLANAKSDEEYRELIKSERKYTEDLKSYAQIQNELIFVRHFFLIENMIISIFRHFVYLMNDVETYKKYFVDKSFFNNIEVCSVKIKELSKNEIDLSSYTFWKYFFLMKNIRNSISHGDILFTMKYNDIDFFNKKFSISSDKQEIKFIVKDVELNGDDLMKHQFPILFHPTNSKDSKWFAHLSDNIEILEVLNKEYLEFCEQIKNCYMNYFGNDKNNILLFGMGIAQFSNKSIYQDDYLLSFESFYELYFKKRMQTSESRSLENNKLLSYKEFENHKLIEYDWSYFKMASSTKNILENEKNIYIFNATFNYSCYVIYVDLIKVEEDSKEIIIYINEIDEKLLEFQIYVLLKLQYNIKDMNLIIKNNENIEFKKIDFLEKNLSTKSKKIKFIEKIEKNLEVIRFCINNHNKPIKEYKLK